MAEVVRPQRAAGMMAGKKSKKRSRLEELLSDDDDDVSIRTDDDEGENAAPSAAAVNGDAAGLAAAVAGDGDVEELKLGDGDGAEALKKKVRVQKRKFDEDTLASEDGLKRIYREFPRSWKCRGRGCEGQDLAKLLTLYKSWAYQLHPGLSLPDIVKSTLKLGTKRPVRDVYGQMKDEERSRYMRDVLGFKEHEPSSPDAMTSPEANSTGGDPDSTSKSVDVDPFDDDLMMQMLDSAYEKEATATTKEASPAAIRSSVARDASEKTPETETKSKSAPKMVELDDSSDEEMDFGGSTREGFQSNVSRAILEGSDNDEGATQEQEEEGGSTFGSAMQLPMPSDSQAFEATQLDPTQLDPNDDYVTDI